jgi:hypothetical protein
MSSFNFAKADVDWEIGQRLTQVVTALETAQVPGNANQRLFPQGEGTPLHLLKKLLRPGQEPAPEAFDFELGEVQTYADAERLCGEAGVNIADVITAKGGRLYFDTNLGDGNRTDVELSKPENACPNVELSKCRFFDTARTVIDWKSSLPGLKALARERKYTAEMMQTCLRKLVSEYCKPHARIIEDMTHNEMANYLLSTENNIDRNIHKKRELNSLKRMPGQELRIPLIMARNLIDKIYPADGADNAAARSSAWRTAIVSFLPDMVALPLLEKMRIRTEDCNPMSDEDVYDFALRADEQIKDPLSYPLAYGRVVGASPVVNQIHFNSIETGSHPYGVPMGGYGYPYQAYQAYPQLQDDPPRRQAPPQQVLPPNMGQVAPAANLAAAAAMQRAEAEAALRAQAERRIFYSGWREAEAAREKDRLEAAQQQQQVSHADTSPKTGDYQQAMNTPHSSAQQGGRYDLARQGPSDPYTPVRSQEARDNVDLVRRTLLDSPYQVGREDGAGCSKYDQGHDLRRGMTPGENQGQGSKGHPYGTRSVSRSKTAATQVVNQPDPLEAIQLLAVTLAEIQKNTQPRGQSRDQSYKRGQVTNGRYTSRERSASRSGYRPPSRNGGRDRSQSRGRDPRDQRSRDTPDSAGRYPSYKRAESKSPRRASGYQKESSGTRNSRSTSRGRSGKSSRPTSGFLQTNYPAMDEGVNCREGYNPLKEKHCTKCYPTADHHEFLCKTYYMYCAKKCRSCGRGHHIELECKDRVETFPPKVGEPHTGRLAKN